MHLKKIWPIFMLVILSQPFSLFAKDIEKDDILGLWLSEEKDGVIKVSKDGDEYQGHLIWIKEIATGEKKEILDKENPDESKRSRSLQGIKLFYGFHYDDEEWTNGSIYDPKSGKTYNSYLELKDDKTLKLRGYVGIPLFGRTSVWTRIKELPKLEN